MCFKTIKHQCVLAANSVFAQMGTDAFPQAMNSENFLRTLLKAQDIEFTPV